MPYGRVMRAPLSGGTPETIASGTTASAIGPAIAVDATSVYWTSAMGVMRRTPK